MSTDLNSSFNEQYLNINTKLKKRFMRKPNVSEATNEFVGLAIQAEHCEQPTFGAHAFIGAAKCEASAGNFLSEAEHYLSAARLFMKAEKKLRSLNFYTSDRENLEASIGCFMLAQSKYPENSPIRTSIYLEIAGCLKSFNLKQEAVSYYQKALNTTHNVTIKFIYMLDLAKLQMDCGDYEAALETVSTICDSNVDLPEDIISEATVNRILLALHTEMAVDSRPESIKQLFIDLINDEQNNSLPYINIDLKLKLQSIVLCCSTNDLPSLVQVCSDSKHLFTNHQNELLTVMIKKRSLDNFSIALET